MVIKINYFDYYGHHVALWLHFLVKQKVSIINQELFI